MIEKYFNFVANNIIIMGIRIDFPTCSSCKSLIENNLVRCNTCNQTFHNISNCVTIHNRFCFSSIHHEPGYDRKSKYKRSSLNDLLK